ncbi:hypothetical protein SBRCBS47491_006717 [Sporothrix bragantina]|uniref:Guanylate kinase-like domain-containing protein n=1 Tax=Sporothrix bragantina TaxID=671064 RepID=A0ABP0C7K4_9PEZI
MPGLEINSHGIPAVEAIGVYLQELLDHAEIVKPERTLEPTLVKSDFDDIYGHVARMFTGFDDPSGRKLRQYAIVETAARDIFGKLIASTSIDSPDFVRVWNLFDILAILSDNIDCDPPLLFWLIEELLDSQTIAGCRRVFDYLESRRERITAKYFNNTKLVILRSCNDLLRRLSRADDTPFCGRVFIFLFQVFPLGDKSSVNLRGEFHVENVTTYDKTPAKAGGDEEDGAAEKMDVDDVQEKDDAAGKKVAGKDKKHPPTDFAALYPIFWSLQESFSQPKKLFEPTQFSQFKAGMDASLAAFQQISSQDDSRKSRQMDDSKRGAKRKRDKEEAEVKEIKADKEDELADTYNPKYLTSRDLFELETSDLTFRRHFLLQALIIMEFLLSLSPKAKEKLAGTNAPNKSVTYSDQTLSEEDTAWATKMKHDITEHIKSSNNDGPYFLRMVDTILARDKNWVRWKIESCPSIERPAVSADEFLAATDSAERAFQPKRRRSTSGVGSFSLDFLDEEDPEEALAELKKPSHSRFSALDTFEREIADEDFEIEMPDSDASKQQAEERKASKTWRALRIVRQTNLSTFDKIDDDNNVQVIFKMGDGNDDDYDEAIDGEGEDGEGGSGEAATGDKLPENKQPLVLVGPDSEIAALVAKQLSEKNSGVFGIVGQHTTRPALPKDNAENTPKGYYQHIESKAFDALLDGDEFVGFGETSAGFMYGSRRKQIDAVAASNKVPIVLMNYESVDAAKGNAFTARYVFIQPTSTEEALEPLLKATGMYNDDAALQAALTHAKEVIEKAAAEQDVFDMSIDIAADDVEGAAAQLGSFVYGKEGKEVKDEEEGGGEAMAELEVETATEGKGAEEEDKAAPEEEKAFANNGDDTTAETPAPEGEGEEDAQMADADGEAADEGAVEAAAEEESKG